jgi:protein-S-isoprenylcysteine O-methyltransferase Ste14
MVIAFVCHSPFLVIYSLVWFPAFYIISLAEEKDLVLRYKEDYIQYQKRVGMFWPRSRGASS